MFKTNVVALLLTLSGTGMAQAGVILSGDSTVAFYSDSVTPNGQFFANILGSGEEVRILTPTIDGIFFLADNINNHFNSLAGVTSSKFSGSITTADLNNVDLLAILNPADSFESAEVIAIKSFVESGGTLFVSGEGGTVGTPDFGVTTNGYVNSLLTGIGVSMQLSSDTLDTSLHNVLASRVAAHPLTAGTVGLQYGATSVVQGGTPLYFSENDSPFVAVSAISAVPEPSSLMVILVLGSLGVFAMRLRIKPNSVAGVPSIENLS